MCHNNDFSDKAIAYINKVKEIGKGKKEELDKFKLILIIEPESFLIKNMVIYMHY